MDAILKAVKKSDINELERLLVRGTNVNLQNMRGTTPLNLAVTEGKVEVVKFLILQKRIDLNLANALNQSPLLIACKDGFDEITSILLDLDVDINLPDIYGNTPIR